MVGLGRRALDAVVTRGANCRSELTAVSASASKAIDDCVHCGFCLPACPTYALWQLEPDSPRGRIQLVEGVLAGRIERSADYAARIDNCLGCLSCVSACPSGVAYDKILDFARADLASARLGAPEKRWSLEVGLRLLSSRRLVGIGNRARSLLERAGAIPALRGSVGWRHLPAPLRALDSLAGGIATTGAGIAAFGQGDIGPGSGEEGERWGLEGPVGGASSRGEVVVLDGCVQAALFPEVNAATAHLLELEGFTVRAKAIRGCCGALSLHEGRRRLARSQAAAVLAQVDPENVVAIVTNAAGCGSAMKSYGELFAGDPRRRRRAEAVGAAVRDVSQILAAVATSPQEESAANPVASWHPVSARVVYHDACHLLHAQHVAAEPRALLAQIPGLCLLELDDSALCCGSAGLYNLVHPVAAAELGARKADRILDLSPDLVVTGNPGCLLQLRRHLSERAAARGRRPPLVLQTVELLDASRRGGASAAALCAGGPGEAASALFDGPQTRPAPGRA